MHLRLVLLVAALIAFASPATANQPSLFSGLFGPQHGPTKPGSHLTISVDISTQQMIVADEWHTIYTFDVSTGRKGHTTPTGTFHPIRMHEMWHSSKYENAPMPWSIFFHGGYAIHGTNDIKHLGHIASHGCVRLHPDNAKLLYDLVREYGMGNTVVLLKA